MKVDVTECNKHCSLLLCGINYDRKKLYRTVSIKLFFNS
jgi:hypothetical protein